MKKEKRRYFLPAEESIGNHAYGVGMYAKVGDFLTEEEKKGGGLWKTASSPKQARNYFARTLAERWDIEPRDLDGIYGIIAY